MLIKQRQSGATLITALIMLIVLTLLVVSGIRSSNTNLRIAGNVQMQAEASAAAQQAIERVISSANFDISPQTVGSYSVTIARPRLLFVLVEGLLPPLEKQHDGSSQP